MPRTETKPFLRWVGGKRRLLNELHKRLPTFTGRYYEPFIGGGAMFFALDIPGSRCVVNDAVPDVALAYQVLRDDADGLVRGLRRHATSTTEADYYALRAKRPTADIQRAARTIALNRLCFNGLFRMNNQGKFNVAYGKLARPTVCDEQLLRVDAARLAGTLVRQGDFETAVHDAQAGDFVYLDPPYIPHSPTASFSKYAKDDFREPEHRRLASAIDDLTGRGVLVMLSNSDTPLTRHIYRGLHLESVQVSRSVAARGSARRSVPEVIGTNYGPPATKGTALSGSGRPVASRTTTLSLPPSARRPARPSVFATRGPGDRGHG